jgi:hypothetical protein
MSQDPKAIGQFRESLHRELAGTLNYGHVLERAGFGS